MPPIFTTHLWKRPGVAAWSVYLGEKVIMSAALASIPTDRSALALLVYINAAPHLHVVARSHHVTKSIPC